MYWSTGSGPCSEDGDQIIVTRSYYTSLGMTDEGSRKMLDGILSMALSAKVTGQTLVIATEPSANGTTCYNIGSITAQ